jgi:hypothetical protein
MAEDNTDMNSRGALVIPIGFMIGDTVGGGDCFFESVAQGMNELSIPGGPSECQLLRQACFNYVGCNQGSIYDSRNHKTWSLPKCTLGIPYVFTIGEAAGEGDYFFDSVAQGMNQLSIPGGQFIVKLLKQACFDYAKVNKDSVYNSKIDRTLHQVIAEDAVAGVCASKCRHEHTDCECYLVHIQLTAAEQAILNLGAATWGTRD